MLNFGKMVYYWNYISSKPKTNEIPLIDHKSSSAFLKAYKSLESSKIYNKVLEKSKNHKNKVSLTLCDLDEFNCLVKIFQMQEYKHHGKIEYYQQFYGSYQFSFKTERIYLRYMGVFKEITPEEFSEHLKILESSKHKLPKDMKECFKPSKSIFGIW